jgi:competence protein ComEC
VLMVQLGPWRVLWLSDTGWHAEKALCSSSEDLHCDVLIRSQHEVDLSTSAEFLLKARPQIILCGSDARAVETALPDPLVQRAKAQNIPLLDTWSTGSIDLQFHQDELRIVTNRSKQRLVLKPR